MTVSDNLPTNLDFLCIPCRILFKKKKKKKRSNTRTVNQRNPPFNFNELERLARTKVKRMTGWVLLGSSLPPVYIINIHTDREREKKKWARTPHIPLQ